MPLTKNKKTVIVIAGPTAVGKTAAAIAVAEHFHSSIISADSRQCYAELNIGVARPSGEELKIVKHYFIASHSVQEEITAAGFEQYALQKTEELFKQNDVVVMTGGTGLYIKAFCEGLDTIPEVPAATRQRIIAGYEQQGLAWLQKQVEEKDRDFYSRGEIQNPQRLMRALEVVEATGKSILHYRSGQQVERGFTVIKIALELPREELNSRIDARVDQMMRTGLPEEVKALLPYRHLNALQTVGYKELFDYFDHRISLAEATAMIKTHTRQYAKRQMTWFRKDKTFTWFSPGDTKGIIAFINEQLAS